jgi:hypothetical protein
MILESTAAIRNAVPWEKKYVNDRLGKNVYMNKNQCSSELFFRWLKEYFAV